MRFLVFFGMMLVLTPLVVAQTQINIYLDDIGDALFLGQTTANLSLPEGVSLENGRITGYSSNLTKKSGDVWTFSYALPESELTVYLPEGAVVKHLSGGEIFLENNQIAVSIEDSFSVTYTIEKINKDDSIFAFFGVIGGLIAILVIVYVLNFHKRDKRVKKTKRPDKAKIVHALLNEREKLILQTLKETGKTKMSYLRQKADIPKASFSRHIRELERKKLVKLSGDGRNKIVELTR